MGKDKVAAIGRREFGRCNSSRHHDSSTENQGEGHDRNVGAPAVTLFWKDSRNGTYRGRHQNHAEECSKKSNSVSENSLKPSGPSDCWPKRTEEFKMGRRR